VILTIPAHESIRNTDSVAAPNGAKTSTSNAPMQQNKKTAKPNLRQSLGVETAAGGVLNSKFRSSFEKAGLPLNLRRSATNPKLPVMMHTSTKPSPNMYPNFSKSSGGITVFSRTCVS
jgi:hypothetical protein